VADIAALKNSRADDDRAAMKERLGALDEHLTREIESLCGRQRALRELRVRLEQGEAVLAGPGPASFGELEQALMRAGVSPAGIAEERRVWAALEGLALPEAWTAAIDRGVQLVTADPELLHGFGEMLEVVARLRNIERHDPAVEEAISLIVSLAHRYPPGDAITLIADPLGASIIHTIARCFTAVQQEAFASAFLRISESSSNE
jgi:hypothetical protein